MKRRLRSARAAVFSEFAFIVPVLVLFLSAMIELAAFWDSKVMATHTAWQIGRIASVRVYEDQQSLSTLHGLKFGETFDDGICTNRTVPSFDGQFAYIASDLGVKNKMETFGDVAALFLMSTCGIGAFGQKYNENVASKARHLLVEQAGMITDALVENLKELIKESLGIDDSTSGGGSWFDTLKKLVYKLVDTLIDAILQPILDKLIEIISPLLQKILGIDSNAFSDATWKHFAKRLSAAAVRVKRPEYKVTCSVEDAGTMAHGDGRVWSSGWGKDKPNVFFYPQTASLDDERDRGWIKKANVWPIQKMKQSLVDVKVEWPYTGSWLFPVVSTLGTKGKVIVTRGYSRVYTQPAIDNEFLLSRGATKYNQGVVQKKYDFDDLDIGAYIRNMAFSMDYRMRNESITKGGWDWDYTGYHYEPFWGNMKREDKSNSDADWHTWRHTCRTLVCSYHNSHGDGRGLDETHCDGELSRTFLGWYNASGSGWFDNKWWAYREYWYWLWDSAIHPRYKGERQCRDHMKCDNSVKEKKDRKGNVTQNRWGYSGKSDMMFFNDLDTLKSQEKTPDVGTHAQLENAVMAYDKIDMIYAAKDGVGDDVLAGVAISDQGFADLFRSVFRLNVRSAFYAYHPRAEANDLIATNLYMRTHARGENVKSLLRAQAWDFSMGQHERMASLEKQAKADDEELEDDMVTQSGIDFVNGDSEDVVNQFREWWENQQVLIKGYFKNIDKGIYELQKDCSTTESSGFPYAASVFKNKMDGTVFPTLKKDLQDAYSGLQAQGSKPTTTDGLIDAVYTWIQGNAYSSTWTEEVYLDVSGCGTQDEKNQVVWNYVDRCKANSTPERCYITYWMAWRNNANTAYLNITYGVKSGTSGNAQAFDEAYAALCSSYEKFRLDIVYATTNEAAFASAIGAESSHGNIPLSPDDITGDDNPEDLPIPPGGDPSTSGSDAYPFGDKWKLTDHGWERE